MIPFLKIDTWLLYESRLDASHVFARFQLDSSVLPSIWFGTLRAIVTRGEASGSIASIVVRFQIAAELCSAMLARPICQIMSIIISLSFTAYFFLITSRVFEFNAKHLWAWYIFVLHLRNRCDSLQYSRLSGRTARFALKSTVKNNKSRFYISGRIWQSSPNWLKRLKSLMILLCHLDPREHSRSIIPHAPLSASLARSQTFRVLEHARPVC